MEKYKRKHYFAVPMEKHPGYWDISEDGKPGQGPCYNGPNAQAEAEKFAALLNRQEMAEPAFGRD